MPIIICLLILFQIGSATGMDVAPKNEEILIDIPHNSNNSDVNYFYPKYTQTLADFFLPAENSTPQREELSKTIYNYFLGEISQFLPLQDIISLASTCHDFRATFCSILHPIIIKNYHQSVESTFQYPPDSWRYCCFIWRINRNLKFIDNEDPPYLIYNSPPNSLQSQAKVQDWIKRSWSLRYSPYYQKKGGVARTKRLAKKFNVDLKSISNNKLQDVFTSCRRDPYIKTVLTLGLWGGYVVSGYFLISHIYNQLIASYSPPQYTLQSGGYYSSCYQLQHAFPQVSCNPCYTRRFPFNPPLDYSAIPTYVNLIQQACGLPPNATEAIGTHLNAIWQTLNTGSWTLFMDAQCQQDFFLQDSVIVDSYSHGGLYYKINAMSYAPECMALADSKFAGSIAGWIIFTIISTILLQWGLCA